MQLSWLTTAEAPHRMWIKQTSLACDDANNCPYHPTLLWGMMRNIVESRKAEATHEHAACIKRPLLCMLATSVHHAGIRLHALQGTSMPVMLLKPPDMCAALLPHHPAGALKQSVCMQA